MSAIETRIGYLEKVVDRLITDKIQYKVSDETVKDIKAKKPEGVAKADPPASQPFELVLKQYDVHDPSTGGYRRVNAEVLAADPELLAWMLKSHPACFKS